MLCLCPNPLHAASALRDVGAEGDMGMSQDDVGGDISVGRWSQSRRIRYAVLQGLFGRIVYPLQPVPVDVASDCTDCTVYAVLTVFCCSAAG